MTIQAMVWIMALTGFLGGIVNYLMPSNRDKKDPEKMKQGFFESVIIGIGATILVPLFLELAQSKLLDDIKTNKSSSVHTQVAVLDSTVLKRVLIKSIDTVKRDTCVCDTTVAVSVSRGRVAESPTGPVATSSEPPLKNYLIFAAYCFLAATAGYKFIASVSNSVLKEKELEEVKSELQHTESKLIETTNEKSNLEEMTEEIVRSQKLNEKQRQLNVTRLESKLKSITLPPVTNFDDPQKGRFGGKAENNFRALRAQVLPSHIPDFYSVTIRVESTDPANHPLDKDVTFYLHDTFSPSVYSVSPKDNKALDDEILSYGAFTVGAIADDGKTFLELDLAEQNEFPEGFRAN